MSRRLSGEIRVNKLGVWSVRIPLLQGSRKRACVELRAAKTREDARRMADEVIAAGREAVAALAATAKQNTARPRGRDAAEMSYIRFLEKQVVILLKRELVSARPKP